MATVIWRVRDGRVRCHVAAVPARILAFDEITRWERDMAITEAARLVEYRQRKRATDPTHREKERARARASRQRIKERRIHQDAYQRALQRAEGATGNG